MNKFTQKIKNAWNDSVSYIRAMGEDEWQMFAWFLATTCGLLVILCFIRDRLIT
jgi:hypothetical protein